MFDKLKFWKKDDFDSIQKDLGIGFDTPADPSARDEMTNLGMPKDTYGDQSFGGLDSNDYASQDLGAQDYGSSGRQSYGKQSYPQRPQQYVHQGEPVTMRPAQNEFQGQPQYNTIQPHIEVISAKLDALKAGLDSMNQRLANIERELLHRKW